MKILEADVFIANVSYDSDFGQKRVLDAVKRFYDFKTRDQEIIARMFKSNDLSKFKLSDIRRFEKSDEILVLGNRVLLTSRRQAEKIRDSVSKKGYKVFALVDMWVFCKAARNYVKANS